jgi:hypothetical protein
MADAAMLTGTQGEHQLSSSLAIEPTAGQGDKRSSLVQSPVDSVANPVEFSINSMDSFKMGEQVAMNMKDTELKSAIMPEMLATNAIGQESFVESNYISEVQRTPTRPRMFGVPIKLDHDPNEKVEDVELNPEVIRRFVESPSGEDFDDYFAAEGQQEGATAVEAGAVGVDAPAPRVRQIFESPPLDPDLINFPLSAMDMELPLPVVPADSAVGGYQMANYQGESVSSYHEHQMRAEPTASNMSEQNMITTGAPDVSPRMSSERPVSMKLAPSNETHGTEVTNESSAIQSAASAQSMQALPSQVAHSASPEPIEIVQMQGSTVVPPNMSASPVPMEETPLSTIGIVPAHMANQVSQNAQIAPQVDGTQMQPASPTAHSAMHPQFLPNQQPSQAPSHPPPPSNPPISWNGVFVPPPSIQPYTVPAQQPPQPPNTFSTPQELPQAPSNFSLQQQPATGNQNFNMLHYHGQPAQTFTQAAPVSVYILLSVNFTCSDVYFYRITMYRPATDHQKVTLPAFIFCLRNLQLKQLNLRLLKNGRCRMHIINTKNSSPSHLSYSRKMLPLRS